MKLQLTVSPQLLLPDTAFRVLRSFHIVSHQPMVHFSSNLAGIEWMIHRLPIHNTTQHRSEKSRFTSVRRQCITTRAPKPKQSKHTDLLQREILGLSCPTHVPSLRSLHRAQSSHSRSSSSARSTEEQSKASIMNHPPFTEPTTTLFRGRARTQAPTTRNYTLELPTFGVIARVNPIEVQWKGLALRGLPPWSQYLPRQVSMKFLGAGAQGQTSLPLYPCGSSALRACWTSNLTSRRLCRNSFAQSGPADGEKSPTLVSKASSTRFLSLIEWRFLPQGEVGRTRR